METRINDFMGKKVLGIYNGPDSDFPIVSFGLVKARAILASIDKIQEYVNSIPE